LNDWLIILLLGLGLFLLWRGWIRPFRLLSSRLRSLASESPGRSRIPPALPFPYGGLEKSLRTLEERMDEMQRQLSDESLNLRTILGSMVEGVLIVDSRQQIRLINAGMQAMVPGHPNPMNRSIMEVFRNHELQQAVRHTLDQGEGLRRELALDVHEGEAYHTKYFSITCVPLHKPGRDLVESGLMGAILVFHDITRLKELEAVRRDFVANVSHELRTPLSIIKGYLETLLDGALDDTDQSRAFCQTMLRHTDRLNLLIEDVLNLSKLESGSAPPNLETVDLHEACLGIRDALDQKFSAKEAELVFDFAPEFPAIQADHHQIDQALYNLFDNALKYAGQRPLVLTITGRHQGGWIDLEIRDNGPGIPLEDQPHIFERFYRVHKDRSRDAGGTGLGLSIVKHVASLHGGRVSLESEPGKGAAFTLHLPINPDVAQLPAASGAMTQFL